MSPTTLTLLPQHKTAYALKCPAGQHIFHSLRESLQCSLTRYTGLRSMLSNSSQPSPARWKPVSSLLALSQQTVYWRHLHAADKGRTVTQHACLPAGCLWPPACVTILLEASRHSRGLHRPATFHGTMGTKVHLQMASSVNYQDKRTIRPGPRYCLRQHFTR